MKKFRLSTLMLLVLIIALGLTLVVLQDRPARREALLELKRLKILHANLLRAGVLRKEKAKALSDQFDALYESYR